MASVATMLIFFNKTCQLMNQVYSTAWIISAFVNLIIELQKSLKLP